MDKIRWGIIGCGDVCEKKSGPAFYNIKHSSLVAVMRRDEEKVKDFASRHNIKKYYTSADELINDSAVNAVYIATPPNSHKEYAIKAMEAGKPVYVEKPMAMNFAECIDMIQVAKRTGQKLFVAYYRRSLPYFLKVKEIIDDKVIGDVMCIDVCHYSAPRPADLDNTIASWRTDKRISGGGYFYDMASHTLDMLDYLLGEIETVKGYVKNIGKLYTVEDTVSVIFRFKSGVQGIGQWCFVTNKAAERDIIRINGTKGYVEFGIFDFTPIVLRSDTISEDYSFEQPDFIEQPLIQTVVDELRGWGTCPSTMASAARTSRIIDIIMNVEAK